MPRALHSKMFPPLAHTACAPDCSQSSYPGGMPVHVEVNPLSPLVRHSVKTRPKERSVSFMTDAENEALVGRRCSFRLDLTSGAIFGGKLCSKVSDGDNCKAVVAWPTTKRNREKADEQGGSEQGGSEQCCVIS